MSEPGEVWGHGDGSDAHLDLSMYRVDPDKVKTIEDVVAIINALAIRVNRTYPGFEDIEHLLTKEE